jgi:hypothetical protein
MNGPGKYDNICTVARVAADADCAIVIIINGNHGSGFSVQCTEGLVLDIPSILEHVIKDMRSSINILVN